jgi:hypothetical protein
MNGETMIGVPLTIFAASVLLALRPLMLDALTLASAFFFIIGLLAIIDNLILDESIFKSILRRIFKDSAQLR